MHTQPLVLSDECFDLLACWFHQQAGIYLSPTKKFLVSGRLIKRLRALNYASFEDYMSEVLINSDEAQVAINLLTTNETHFYREEAHFSQLSELITQKKLPSDMRVWSAACSSGEEAYSIAFLLAQKFGLHASWRVDASDISTSVLETASQGIYSLSQSYRIPADFLKQYCLKGIHKNEGTFRIAPEVREKVNFFYWNLTHTRKDNVLYDVIFLRNVLIYFDFAGKDKVIKRISKHLKPSGYLMIGHAESLQGHLTDLTMIRSGCYKRE